ncbi:MAG: hypothetical protein LBT97_02820 [Planctomycetota bacterium]|jgi:hypothetical protein|nr:hypothetical protein [Planctomycetota bacterium]
MQWRLWALAAQAQNTGEVYLTGDAIQEWKRIYPELSAETAGLTGAVVNRAEAQTMRLALVYALLDGKKAMDTPHVTSALALWRYAGASAAALFCDRATDPTEQKVLAILQSGECTTTMLNRALSGHVSSRKLRNILSTLQAGNKINVREEKTAGRNRTIVRLCGTGGVAEKAD